MAIVTNAPLRNDCKSLFDRYGIHNYLVPFDRFTVPDSFKRGYAFYKLCALWHVVHRYGFDTYLELDTDMVTEGDLNPSGMMWKTLGDYCCIIYIENLIILLQI